MSHPAYTASGKSDWSLIPPRMVGGLRRYIENGIAPGHFLSAVLCNDLREAVGRADDENRYRLADYVMFLYNFAPSQCWGSPEKVKAWIEQGGIGAAEVYAA